MAYFFQIVDMKKEDLTDIGLTDVVTEAMVTMVCDHLGARRLANEWVTFPRPESASGFTPFAELTEAQVQTWIENAMGADAVTDMRERLEAECDQVVNGTTNTVTTPPWVTPSAE
ncbi:hypothetical protein CRP235_gp34 [Roseobacter phage CRP-235]|nr:hypothetical protein CRP235_gp34 [Roseobacter phage CRP-235]